MTPGLPVLAASSVALLGLLPVGGASQTRGSVRAAPTGGP